MAYQTLTIEIDKRGVALLTLNRPQVHNALSMQMLEELPSAAKALNRDPNVRVVVLTGAGESFCAGGDLRWMQEVRELDRAGRLKESGKIATVLKALDDLSKPLIGRVNGQAYAGGLGLIAVCDVIIAARRARLRLPRCDWVSSRQILGRISSSVLARRRHARSFSTRNRSMRTRRFGSA